MHATSMIDQGERARRDARPQIQAVQVRAAHGGAPGAASHHERPYLPQRHAKPGQLLDPHGAVAPELQDAIDVAYPEAWHAQELLAAAAVEVDRESRPVAQGPGQLRLDLQVEHGQAVVGHDLIDRKAVEAKQPVRLIKAVFAT